MGLLSRIAGLFRRKPKSGSGERSAGIVDSSFLGPGEFTIWLASEYEEARRKLYWEDRDRRATAEIERSGRLFADVVLDALQNG